MPVNDIVAEVASRQQSSPVERGEAPEEDGAPDGEPAPTTMRTSTPMLPPYLHNQTLDYDGALMKVATVLTLIGFVKAVRKS